MKKELFTHHNNLVSISLVKYSNKNIRIYILNRYIYLFLN